MTYTYFHPLSLSDALPISKAFTGIAVMQLVEDGKLDLAAPISHYLDGLPEGWKPITVRQLATLNAGVPEMIVYTAQSNVALLGDGTEDRSEEHTSELQPLMRISYAVFCLKYTRKTN